MAKQTPKIETRLAESEHLKFGEFSKVKGKTKTAIAREALLWYLSNYEKLTNDSRESLLERRIRKMEERIAALQARTAIDVGMIYHLIYRNMDVTRRDDVIAWAYNSSVQRLRKKLIGEAADIKELMQKGNDQVSSKA